MARVSFTTRCSGWPVLRSILMNGWLISVWLAGRQLDLGLFRRFLQALQRHLVLRQVDAMLFLELVGQVVDDPHVEVFTAKERVAVGGFHFEQAVVDFQDGDVEGAAAKVIDRDRLGLFLVETIGQRGRRRFVDDAQHFKTGDLARVLGGLTLGVVEIGRHGDDGLRDRFAQIGLRRFPSSSAG